MADYPFVLADVFAEAIFGGNQLAVFPDARGLSADTMQRLAREFNFSESCFVLPAEDARCDHRLRIFAPSAELPFAGHPTVGAAAVLAHLGVLAPTGAGGPVFLEEGVGPVEVNILAREGDRIHASLTIKRALERRGPPPPPAAIAEVLGLPAAEIEDCWLASAGATFCHVHLTSREAVDRAALDRKAWSTHLAGSWASSLFILAGKLEPGGVVYARMFAPEDGVEEDPATGSACASLVGTLAERAGAGRDAVTITVEQGVALGRPSRIHGEAKQVEAGLEISVSGWTIVVGSGTIRLP